MAVVRMLNAPITAAGGSDVLVALGSGPFLLSCLVVFLVFLFVDCVGRYAFLTGGNAFLPNADVERLLFAATLCTVYEMFSSPFACHFILTFRTEPPSFIGHSGGKKR